MLKDEKLVSVLALLWCIAAYNMYAAMSKCFFFLYLPSAARCADRRASFDSTHFASVALRSAFHASCADPS